MNRREMIQTGLAGTIGAALGRDVQSMDIPNEPSILVLKCDTPITMESHDRIRHAFEDLGSHFKEAYPDAVLPPVVILPPGFDLSLQSLKDLA